MVVISPVASALRRCVRERNREIFIGSFVFRTCGACGEHCGATALVGNSQFSAKEKVTHEPLAAAAPHFDIA